MTDDFTPTVEEILTLDAQSILPLRNPVMVVALEGWFDMAGAASAAVEALFDDEHRITVGEIEPDPLYDFTIERPHVELVEGQLRTIRWPRNRIDVWRNELASRDVVLLLGVEPHLSWRTYCEAILSTCEELGLTSRHGRSRRRADSTFTFTSRHRKFDEPRPRSTTRTQHALVSRCHRRRRSLTPHSRSF